MKNSLIALALLAAAPFAASAADGLSYNYAQADYVKTDADAGKADGWGVKGSYEFIPHVHAFGEYNQQKADLTDAKTDQWRVGVGYNKFDPKQGLDFNGYSAEAGIRTAFGAHAEVYAMAGYEDYTKKHGINPEGEFYGRLGGQVKLNQNWGINGDLKMNGEGDKEWSIGPRFSW
jgi:Ax21 family sulfation-dependent quorum factor